MADITNGVLKFYDNETQTWVVPETAPIKKLVIEAMIEDFLRLKGDIKLMEIKYGDDHEYSFYIAYDGSTDEIRIEQTQNLISSYIQILYSQKEEKTPLKNSEILAFEPVIDALDTLKKFEVAFDDSTVTRTYRNYDLPNNDIKNFFGMNLKFTLSYVFNDNPIENKQYKFEKASE